MGEFSKEELLILEKSIEQIELQISSGIYENGDKDRMLFASCLNDEEKEELTKKEIKKQQKKLARCPADISAYITAYINPSEFDIGDDDYHRYRERIIKNYVASTFVEVCENLLEHKFTTIASIESEPDYFWEVLIESHSYGVEDIHISNFIKFMIIADRLKGYKSILDTIETERLQEEYAKMTEDEDNEIYKLLDGVRSKDHTRLQLFNIIKEQTNLDPTSLKYFLNDIEVYVFAEKDDYECNYSFEQVEEALESLRKRGHSEEDMMRLGYIRKYPSLGILGGEKGEITTYIDKEKLLFPFEFYSIYEIQGIIKAELAKHNKVQVGENDSSSKSDKLKVNLSVPQLALLFKMINDLKPTVFNLKSEAELHRFISANFQTKQSDPEKGISTQKLRNEFNSPDYKAIEFWEKHLRTMQAEIKKLK
jgi:hypothetical protein